MKHFLADIKAVSQRGMPRDTSLVSRRDLYGNKRGLVHFFIARGRLRNVVLRDDRFEGSKSEFYAISLFACSKFSKNHKS
jgi:hypothetical protein